VSDESALDRDRLVRVLYDELHRVAVRLMRRQRPGHTLQPSALVNEALMRLLAGGLLDRRADRRIVLGAAVQAMRSVLTDHHRRREAGKRGGALQRHPLDGVLLHFEDREKTRYIDLDAAIDELARLEPRQALVVTFRYFLGMSVPEMAEVLSMSVSSVEADWRLARAWLRDCLGEM
jgi:RNA polymerase sigma factor (TIGR02999 family)